MVTITNIRTFLHEHVLQVPTHLFTEMFIQQRVYLKHNTRTHIDCRCYFGPSHIYPDIADTEKTDILKS